MAPYNLFVDISLGLGIIALAIPFCVKNISGICMSFALTMIAILLQIYNMSMMADHYGGELLDLKNGILLGSVCLSLMTFAVNITAYKKYIRK